MKKSVVISALQKKWKESYTFNCKICISVYNSHNFNLKWDYNSA